MNKLPRNLSATSIVQWVFNEQSAFIKYMYDITPDARGFQKGKQFHIRMEQQIGANKIEQDLFDKLHKEGYKSEVEYKPDNKQTKLVNGFSAVLDNITEDGTAINEIKTTKKEKITPVEQVKIIQKAHLQSKFCYLCFIIMTKGVEKLKDSPDCKSTATFIRLDEDSKMIEIIEENIETITAEDITTLYNRIKDEIGGMIDAVEKGVIPIPIYENEEMFEEYREIFSEEKEIKAKREKLRDELAKIIKEKQIGKSGVEVAGYNYKLAERGMDYTFSASLIEEIKIVDEKVRAIKLGTESKKRTEQVSGIAVATKFSNTIKITEKE